MTSRNKIKSDLILKNFWKNNEHFVDLFNAYLFQGEQVLKPEDFTEVDTDISSIIKFNGHAETVQKVLDVVKKTAYGVDFVIFGIENQQKIHYAMPLRHMIGDAFSYLKEYNEIAARNTKEKNWNNTDEFLSKFKATDRLYAVVTICVYYGEKEWDGPYSLIDMISVPEKFRPLISDYKFNLVEVRNSGDLKFHNSDVSTIFNISRFIYKQEYDKINDIYKKQTISSELGLVIGAITESQKIINDALKSEKKGGQMNMCEALKKLEERGRQQGREEGREEGRKEGFYLTRIELIQKKIKRGDSLEKIADDLVEDVEFIQPIHKIIRENPKLTTEEVYKLIHK